MRVFATILVSVMILAAGLFLGFKYIKKDPYNFSATSVDGSVSLKSFDGKYKILYFGFGSCPDVCPATLGLVASVLDELKRDDIAILLITLDPQRDSVKSLDEYAKYFYANSYGLVADDLKKMTKDYGVKYQKIKLDGSALDYSVAHSSSLYLLDKDGKFVSEVSNLTIDNIKNSIKEMIKD